MRSLQRRMLPEESSRFVDGWHWSGVLEVVCGGPQGSVLAEFKSKESMEQLLKEEEIKFRSTHILQAETK